MNSRGPASPMPSAAALPTAGVCPVPMPVSFAAPWRNLPYVAESQQAAQKTPSWSAHPGITPANNNGKELMSPRTESEMQSDPRTGVAALGAERIAQLEDEMVSMRRMLMLQFERNELSTTYGGGAGNTGGGGALTWDGLGKTTGDKSSLWSIVSRLEGEVQVERKLRITMESKLFTLEEAVTRERQSREAQFRTFSAELESNIRHLVGKFEEDLAVLVKQNASNPSSLNQTAPASAIATPQPASGKPITEDRLRTLIKRVDEGLSMGVAALQDQLSSTHGSAALAPPQEDFRHAPQSRNSVVNPGSGAGSGVGGAPTGNQTPGPDSSSRKVSPVRVMPAVPSLKKDKKDTPDQTPQAMAVVPENVVPDVDQMTSDQMIHSWELLQQENKRLKEKRAQALRHRSPTHVPSSAPRSPASSVTGPRSPSHAGSIPNSMARPGAMAMQPGRSSAGTAASSVAATPSRGHPQTMQVPGSGMSALRGSGMTSPAGRQ